MTQWRIDFELTDLPDEKLPLAHELPGILAEVAEVIGVRDTLLLEQRFRGTTVYCHNTDALRRQYRDRMIRKDSVHMTAQELARKYGLSERQIWNILGRVDPVQDDRQMGLFG